MTKLPAKNLLDGSKLPKTTTGEMKDALGKLRAYLHEMLGEDSADKEAARLALGIDLAELGAQIEARAARTELQTRARELEEEIAKKGVPVGSVHYFAMPEPPAGYLKADGSAIGRNTYPDLFAAIETTFGEGDGETTFNLPNLIGRFAEGGMTPGTVKAAGLPNITGYLWSGLQQGNLFADGNGAFKGYKQGSRNVPAESAFYDGNNGWSFEASRSSPVYGASDTVQPPALILLPCIKAFHA